MSLYKPSDGPDAPVEYSGDLTFRFNRSLTAGPEAFPVDQHVAARTSVTNRRIPDDALSGVRANQLNDGNSTQTATCSPSSGDHEIRYVK